MRNMKHEYECFVLEKEIEKTEYKQKMDTAAQSVQALIIANDGLILDKEKFPLTTMGVLAPGSAHDRPSARLTINMSRNFLPHVTTFENIPLFRSKLQSPRCLFFFKNFKICPRLLRGWGRCLKVTLQTRAAANFRSRRWGAERKVSHAQTRERGPPSA